MIEFWRDNQTGAIIATEKSLIGPSGGIDSVCHVRKYQMDGTVILGINRGWVLQHHLRGTCYPISAASAMVNNGALYALALMIWKPINAPDHIARTRLETIPEALYERSDKAFGFHSDNAQAA